MRSFILIPIIASALFFSGCASTGTRLLKSNDAESFSQIHTGQGYDEITGALEPFVENSFSVLEDGVRYQYLQSRHQKTGVLIGFYFEDEKLSGLIMGDDVHDFHTLRMSDAAEDHWLNRGMSYYKTWIGERDKLENGESLASSYQVALDEKLLARKETNTKTDGSREQSSGASEIIIPPPGAIAPLLAAIAIIGGTYWVGEKIVQAGSNRAHQREIQNEEQLFPVLHIGMTKWELFDAMLRLDSSQLRTGNPEIYTFLIPTLIGQKETYSFGLQDGRVVWVENCSMLTGGQPPVNRQKVDSMSEICGNSYTYWRNEPRRIEPDEADSMESFAKDGGDYDLYRWGHTAYKDENYIAAYQYWRPLAENGLLHAQVGLSHLYSSGQGVRQDAAKAWRWYDRSIKQDREHTAKSMNRLQGYLITEFGTLADDVDISGEYVSVITGNPEMFANKWHEMRVSLRQDGVAVSGIARDDVVELNGTRKGDIVAIEPDVMFLDFCGCLLRAGSWKISPDGKRLEGIWESDWHTKGSWNLTRIE